MATCGQSRDLSVEFLGWINTELRRQVRHEETLYEEDLIPAERPWLTNLQAYVVSGLSIAVVVAACYFVN